MDARALGKVWGSFPEAREPSEYLLFPRASCALCLFPPSLLTWRAWAWELDLRGLNTHPCPSPVQMVRVCQPELPTWQQGQPVRAPTTTPSCHGDRGPWGGRKGGGLSSRNGWGGVGREGDGWDEPRACGCPAPGQWTRRTATPIPLWKDRICSGPGGWPRLLLPTGFLFVPGCRSRWYCL